MDFLVKDGDYVFEGGGNLTDIFNKEQYAQMLGVKISASKGEFFADLSLGSELFLLVGEKNINLESRAREYIEKALAGENVYIESIDVINEKTKIIVNVNIKYIDDINNNFGNDNEIIKIEVNI